MMGYATKYAAEAPEPSPEAVAAFLQLLAADTEIAALRARVARLEEALRLCADDLETEVEDRYRGTKDHPAMTHKYERDIEPVTAARALLSEEARP